MMAQVLDHAKKTSQAACYPDQKIPLTQKYSSLFFEKQKEKQKQKLAHVKQYLPRLLVAYFLYNLGTKSES